MNINYYFHEEYKCEVVTDFLLFTDLYNYFDRLQSTNNCVNFYWNIVLAFIHPIASDTTWWKSTTTRHITREYYINYFITSQQ